MTFGLIALAVVAFAVVYVALHTPQLITLNIAEEWYYAKLKAAWGAKSLETSNLTVFNSARTNATYYVVVNGIGYPVAVKAEGAINGTTKVVYSVYLYLSNCTYVYTATGERARLYIIAMRHPQIMPWLDVYTLYPGPGFWQYFKGRVIGYDDPLYPRGFKYLVAEKAEWALVRAPDGSYALYVLAPPNATAVYVVDYPAGFVFACP